MDQKTDRPIETDFVNMNPRNELGIFDAANPIEPVAKISP